MRPRGIVCNMCGGEFFARSLPIHQKTCAEKQKSIRLTCQHCGQEVLKLELDQHLSRCPKAPKVATQSQAPGSSKASSGPISTAFDEQGRLQCAVCGRWFNADRIATHQNICSRISTHKRQTFDSFKQRKFDPLIQKAEPRPDSPCWCSVSAARSYYTTSNPSAQCGRTLKETSQRSKAASTKGGHAATGLTTSPQARGSVRPAGQRPPAVMHVEQASTVRREPCPANRGGLSGLPAGSGGATTGPMNTSGVSRIGGARPAATALTTASGSSRVKEPVGVQGRKIRGSGNVTKGQDPPRQSPGRRGREVAPLGRPGLTGPSRGLGGISTSNVCSPDNAFAYPSYPS